VQAFRDFLTVSRARIQIVSLASALLGPSMAASSISDLMSMDVLLFILLFYITVTFSCNINCYYDRDVDRLYKKNLYFATERLGKRLNYIMATEAVSGLAISLILILRGRWITGSLGVLGLFLAHAYSSPPLRVKRRGLISPVPVMVGVYVLPIIAGYATISTEFPVLFWAFLTGYFFLNLGINLVNAAEDADVDSRAGIETLAVRLGVKRTLGIAVLSQVMGLLAPVSMFLYLNDNCLIVLAFFLLSLFKAVQVLYEIYGIYTADDPLKAAKEGGKKLPAWFVGTRYPLLFMAIFALL
jgi:4-hydroxybenzoate polyprenyltransferase